MHPGVYIVLGVFILLIVWGVSYQKKISKKRYITIKKFADERGLFYNADELKQGVAKLTGELQGHNFEYYEEQMPLTFSSDHSFWTILKFENCPVDFSFKISQEVGAMKVAKAIGFNDVLLDDEEIDEAFYFQASEAAKLNSVFDVQNRSDLIEIKGFLNGIIENDVQQGTFTYYYFGRIQQDFQMPPVESVLDFMLKIQKRLS